MLDLVGVTVQREVFANFHKTDAVSVGKVIKVLKEDLLLSVTFVVITILLASFTNHVLTVGVGLI